jgi:hypothetical protein
VRRSVVAFARGRGRKGKGWDVFFHTEVSFSILSEEERGSHEEGRIFLIDEEVRRGNAGCMMELWKGGRRGFFCWFAVP